MALYKKGIEIRGIRTCIHYTHSLCSGETVVVLQSTKKCSGSLLFSFRSRALRLLKMWGKVFDNRQGPMIWRQAASKMLINLSISISSHLERRDPSVYEERRRPHKVEIICTQTSPSFCNNTDDLRDGAFLQNCKCRGVNISTKNMNHLW